VTATPPRADLRTLAAEPFWAVVLPALSANADPRLLDLLAHALEAGVAAVLPEHRRTVLTEAADEVWAELRRIRLDAGRRSTVSVEHINGWEDATGHLERLAAAAPPAGLSAPVPAETAPPVPEEAAPDLREMAGRWFKLADDADWLTTWLTAHGLSTTAGPGQVVRAVARDLQAWAVTGQPANGEVRCACDDFGDGECVVHDALTYAEMESERDRLARELHEAQMMIERLTVTTTRSTPSTASTAPSNTSSEASA
jgi:hypothetical protein